MSNKAIPSELLTEISDALAIAQKEYLETYQGFGCDDDHEKAVRCARLMAQLADVQAAPDVFQGHVPVTMEIHPSDTVTRRFMESATGAHHD